jgi:sugar O-acyltransferase (sialic acid O-acetyltransferase NeuD family)
MVSAEHIVILGAGGHAKAAIGAAQLAGYVVERAYDDDPKKWGKALLGVPIEGPIERVHSIGGMRVLIAVGDATLRAAMATRLALPCITVVHPRAFLHPSVSLGQGTIVFAGAVIQPDVTVGAHAIINANVTVSYDCIVEDFVHLSPGVDLAGGVHVAKGAFLGTGAVVLRGIQIGEWTSVGAGSAVVADLPGYVLAAGSPARIIRQLPPGSPQPTARSA